MTSPLSSRLRGLLAVFVVLLVTGCASLPGEVPRTPSTALTNTADTHLAKEVRADIAAHPGLSGILPLQVAEDAFAARILLARHAERSLDLQYYIWHNDTTGQLMFQAIWQAAERGVRVRLLLDDANTRGLDPTLAVLSAHPNIEVRLFNPFANRGFRAGDFALDFSRVNRRMHNKSFTADNQVAIVGGRNIGDEYFGADMAVGFQDLDVVAVGPVVQQVSDEFDLFWNSPSAYPAKSLLPKPAPGDAAALQASWARLQQDPEAQHYLQAVRNTGLVRALDTGDLHLEWAPAHVIHDDPAKVVHPTDRSDLQMLPLLEEALGKPQRELDLVSPYFVPGKEGTEALAELAQRGVQVRVLTNSLSATDVAPVHAGYSKYRKQMLQAGITLYELKPGSALPPPDRDGDSKRGLPGSRGSSAASLHAKTFAVDRERIFVGSFNIDPRSERLNTEMGMVIDSPALAGALADQLDTRIPEYAYRVTLDPQGHGLVWTEITPQGEKRYTTEPGAKPMKRLYIDFLEILPIEWLL